MSAGKTVNQLQLCSDEELMVLYQNDDLVAFQVLYERHSGRLYEFLRKKAGPAVAGDLLQEVFEKLHKSRLQYQNEFPFLPWIFTIARNTAWDFHKKAESKLRRASDSLDEEKFDNLVSQQADVESPDFVQMLSSLPETQRQAIELRYLQDWSFAQISEKLALSEQNVRQVMSRGLRKLKNAIGGGENK